MVEGFRPVGFKLDHGDTFFMGNEQVTRCVKETYGVDGVWENNLTEELLITVPDSYNSTSVTSDQQINEFVEVAPGEWPVMLPLLFAVYVE